MWLRSLLDLHCRREPTAPALVDSRRQLTWARFHDEVTALAVHLAQRTRRGDRVLVMSANCVEVIEAYFACAQAGVIACPLNPAYTAGELGHILDRLEPAAVVADAASLDRLPGELERLSCDEVSVLPPADERDLRPLRLEEPALILQTSATTGFPKGVVVNQRSLQANALAWLGDLRPRAGLRFLQVSPLCHGSMVIAFDYLAAGCPVHVLERFTPQGCAAALESWRVQEAFLVPSMVQLLLEWQGLEAVDLKPLERISHGAAPMPPELARRAGPALGVELHNIYGITEGGGPALGLSSESVPPESGIMGATCAGLPMTGVAVRICREDGNSAEPKEVGSVQLSGDGLMLGYWRDPGATAAALRGDWLVTGDLGYRDERGYVWLVDRRTDLILRGGQNVYPAEIERVLRSDPAVADVAVVAVPHEAWGQTPFAFVEMVAGRELDSRSLLRLCVRELASYKRPSGFAALDRIPRNSAGKILRRQLRERAAAAAAERPVS